MSRQLYFGFAIADNMFPHPECIILRYIITPQEAKKMIEEKGAIPCLNPSHKHTIGVMQERFGIRVVIPEKAPVVKLKIGDRIIVMGVSGLPRLEGRHEYTSSEIVNAVFQFSLYQIR